MFSSPDKQVDELAQEFFNLIVQKGVFPSAADNDKFSEVEDTQKEYTEVDLSSTEEIESRSLGGEWLAKQAVDRLAMDDILASLGMSAKDIIMCKALLTAKIVHPSNELETERWLE